MSQRTGRNRRMKERNSRCRALSDASEKQAHCLTQTARLVYPIHGLICTFQHLRCRVSGKQETTDLLLLALQDAADRRTWRSPPSQMHCGKRHMRDWWRPTAPSERDIGVHNKEHLRGNIFSRVTVAGAAAVVAAVGEKSSQVKVMKGRRAGDWMLSGRARLHWHGGATSNSIYGAALNGKGLGCVFTPAVRITTQIAVFFPAISFTCQWHVYASGPLRH